MVTCIICGKEFKPKNKVQKTCCFACRQEYKRIAAQQWKEKNKDKIQKYQQTQNELRKKQTRQDKEKVESLQQHKHIEEPVINAPRVIICEQDDPKWILKYAASGRLDRISLLARALNDICKDKPVFTYGNLSRIWGTEKYFKLEEQAIIHKRLEANE